MADNDTLAKPATTPTHFIPGLERKGPLSAMNQAVIDYRRDGAIIKKPVWGLQTDPFVSGAPHETRYPLKEFQKTGIVNAAGILNLHNGVIIADDMGLGKTIEAIILSKYMGTETLLLVVPANVLYQWQLQYYKWTRNLPYILKTKKEAAAYTPTHHPIAMCTYELLDSVANEDTVNFKQWDMIIYDEIQKLRSRNAKMCLAARTLRERARYVVGLTGTLQWGYRRDLWNPLRCIFKYKFGTADEFDYAYCGAYINEHGGKENKGHTSLDGRDRSIELDIRLSHVSVSRTRKDVAAELPTFERRVIRIPCTQKATIALHAFLRKELPYTNAIMSTTSEKTDPVLELLEGMSNAIILTYTKADVALLAAKITAMGRKVYVITGNTPKAERVAIIRVAATEAATIVATIDSTGVGVDGLQLVSSNIIFHSLSHSPKLHLQAEARAHRLGQVNPVVIHYIVMNDSADELVVKVLTEKSKQDGSNTAVDDAKTFGALALDDASMQKALDEWYKNVADELADDSNDDWSDADDDE